MVWKQSLAKIKQDLKATEGEAPKVSPPPKVAPKRPEEVKPMEDEDALFLMAMGAKAQPKAPRKVPVEAPPSLVAAPSEKPKDEDFGEAMASLKGMKALGRPEVVEKAENPVLEVAVLPVETPSPEAPPVVAEPEVVPPPPAPPEAVPAAPRRIQLAAGMAIEVDGSIDLRGHSMADARERLKERVLDSVCLGWRTLHVILGDSEARREAFLDYLASADPRTIDRYAQAPIPMGGASAWILYLGKP